MHELQEVSINLPSRKEMKCHLEELVLAGAVHGILHQRGKGRAILLPATLYCPTPSLLPEPWLGLFIQSDQDLHRSKIAHFGCFSFYFFFLAWKEVFCLFQRKVTWGNFTLYQKYLFPFFFSICTCFAYMSVCMFPVHMYVCTRCFPGAPRGQKKASDPLQLE